VEELARRVGAELILLRVVEPISAVEGLAAAGVVAPEAFYRRELEAREYLGRAQQRVAGHGGRVRVVLRSGQPAPAIVAAAAEAEADLIAMATHGRSGIGRVALGSVAESVLRAASIPVLLLRAAQPASRTDPAEARHGQ
jgi:nucleotide-binding universal stress UspA family protein